MKWLKKRGDIDIDTIIIIIIILLFLIVSIILIARYSGRSHTALSYIKDLIS